MWARALHRQQLGLVSVVTVLPWPCRTSHLFCGSDSHLPRALLVPALSMVFLPTPRRCHTAILRQLEALRRPPGQHLLPSGQAAALGWALGWWPRLPGGSSTAVSKKPVLGQIQLLFRLGLFPPWLGI